MNEEETVLDFEDFEIEFQTLIVQILSLMSTLLTLDPRSVMATI